MKYDGLVKRLVLPPGKTPPTLLAWKDVRAHAITRAHLHDAAVNVRYHPVATR